MMRAYQVYQGYLDWHQMTLLTNMVITNYRSQGLINLPVAQNNMINFWPEGLFSNSVCLLLQHLVTKWVSTLT